MARIKKPIIDRSDRNTLHGFTLLELLIVVAIGLIVTSLAIPAIRQAMRSYQLDSSGHEVASLLEAARLTAVTSNQPYYALYNQGLCVNVVCAVPATGSPNPPNGNNHTSADPTVAVSTSVSFQVANLPNHLQLDTYLGIPNVQVETGTAIGFNARGLPCMASLGSPFVCAQKDPNLGGIPAFEWFMRDGNQNWEAITVSPAGRIKTWRMVTQAGGCGFATCWQ